MTNRFNYVKYDLESNEASHHFQSMVMNLEVHLEAVLKPSRERALAVTKLEECYMWIGKAIKIDQESREIENNEKGDRA